MDKDGKNEKSMTSRYGNFSTRRTNAYGEPIRSSVQEAAALVPDNARADDMSLSGEWL